MAHDGLTGSTMVRLSNYGDGESPCTPTGQAARVTRQTDRIHEELLLHKSHVGTRLHSDRPDVYLRPYLKRYYLGRDLGKSEGRLVILTIT